MKFKVMLIVLMSTLFIVGCSKDPVSPAKDPTRMIIYSFCMQSYYGEYFEPQKVRIHYTIPGGELTDSVEFSEATIPGRALVDTVEFFHSNECWVYGTEFINISTEFYAYIEVMFIGDLPLDYYKYRKKVYLKLSARECLRCKHMIYGEYEGYMNFGDTLTEEQYFDEITYRGEL